MIEACTIVARNYLPHARVLAESFLEHNPDGRFTILLIDDETREIAAQSPSDHFLRLSDIGLDSHEIGRLAAIYDVTELATSVKPLLLRTLLEQGRDHIIYLDPDIKVYASLHEAADLARRHSIILTPHTMVPVPRDGRRVETANILASGVFNLGFLALGERTSDFLTWWWQQTRREAVSDIGRMMFTDQRCMDLSPCLFEHFILKDPGYNVAYWNLHGRDLSWTDDGYRVDQSPLRFFHFSGFDHRTPYLLSKHQVDQPRILLSERPDVGRICREYVDDLRRLGADDRPGPDYGWGRLPGGVPLDKRIRRLYYEALVSAEANDQEEPPNPFDPQSAEAFVQWLNEPVAPSIRPVISRVLHAIYLERPDLRAAFPVLAGDDAGRYLSWFLRDGIREVPQHQALLPRQEALQLAREPAFAPSNELTPGVNLVGYLKTITGVGEHARLLIESLETTQLPFTTFSVVATLSLETQPHVERGDRRAPYDCNVICVNADQTLEIASRLGPSFFEGRYNIGYWAWELDRLPEWMHSAFEVLDEVWCASRFIAEAVRAANRRPVHTIPYPFVVPAYRKDAGRATYGLPDRFMFLFIFDFLSIAERKNPWGLVDAFAQAFSPREDPILVIKCVNGDKRLKDLERLRSRVGDMSNVLLIEDYFSKEQKNGLLALCDCYASLHRSEGTGITLAEAMALGKPVIGTAYSGTLEFMTDRNSYLVDYVRTKVPVGCEPYPQGYVWADPLLDQAAEHMRRVFEDRKEAARRGAQAREDIRTKHSPSVCGARLAARLEEIRHDRPRRAAGKGPVTNSETSSSSLTAGELLHRATALLTPRADLPAGARLRNIRLRAQRLMLRAMRPYWWGQRQLADLLITAIDRVDQTRAADELTLRARLDSLDSHMAALVESVSAARSLASPKRLDSVESQVKNVGASVSAVEAQVATMTGSVSGFQTSASTHLAALTGGVSQLEEQLGDLINRLYSVPYMNNPAELSYVDQAGRKRLGFRSAPTPREGYIGFEDIFRGSEPFVRDRFRAYLPFLESEPIVDVGCGRGELLELVRELGRTGIGVDLDEQMVRRCLSKGLNATQADGVAFLLAQEDSSLGVIFSSQVIEHLDHTAINAFFDAAFAKLRPGGLLIAETVNPHSLEALKGFWVDLTHRAPIFPEVALALCLLRRFDSAFVLFPNGVGDFEEDRRTQGEYAVIARKLPP